MRLDLPLLSAFLPLGLPPNARTAAYTPAERADATQRLLLRLLTARLSVQDAATCVIVDGAESMHLTSYALLAKLLEATF